MLPLRVLPLFVPLMAACNLFVSLDPLQRAEGDGGASSSSSGLSGPSSSSAANSGGAGTGGGGGALSAWESCVLTKQPRIYLRMSGSIVEPNLGTLASVAPTATYFPPHAQVPSLLDGDPDGAASFDDPATNIGDAGEHESGRLELADPGDLDGYGEFSMELWFRMPSSFDAGPLVERATSTGGFRIELQPRIVSDGLDQVIFFFFDENHAGTYGERRRQMIRNVDLGGEGEVHHLVVVHQRGENTEFDLAGNGDDVRVWVDGTPPTTKACCGPVLLPDITAPLTIGNGYSGAIDEFVLYDRVLSPAEIQFHHAVGRDSSLSCE
jgi:hypothetical protein